MDEGMSAEEIGAYTRAHPYRRLWQIHRQKKSMFGTICIYPFALPVAALLVRSIKGKELDSDALHSNRIVKFLETTDRLKSEIPSKIQQAIKTFFCKPPRGD